MITKHVQRARANTLVSYMHHHGYTLLELIVSCSVMAILFAIAAPSFATIIDKTRMKSTTSNLQQSLLLARSTAISQASTVLVCQIAEPEGSNCVASHKRNINWVHGWQIYLDKNGNSRYDDVDTLLSRHKPDKNTAIIFNQNGRLSFFANGAARSAGFYICTRNSTYLMHIKLLHTGRSRTLKSLNQKKLKLCTNAIKST